MCSPPDLAVAAIQDNGRQCRGAVTCGVAAKDIILALIAKIGTGGGQGYVIEYRGSAIESLSMEAG